jgi:hypothetical protein
MGGKCSTNGEKRNSFRLLVRNLEGKRPLERPKLVWVNNIKMDLGEIGLSGLGWIDLAQDKEQWTVLVNSVTNLRVPLNARKLLSSYSTVGLSSSTQFHRKS